MKTKIIFEINLSGTVHIVRAEYDSRELKYHVWCYENAHSDSRKATLLFETDLNGELGKIYAADKRSYANQVHSELLNHFN